MAPPQWAYQVDNFDPPPDEELICSICRAVFCEPVQCPCHHVFCRQCISKWLQENYSCPVCRKRVATRLLQDVVPIVKNMIMKLTLHCHNFELGCEDKLTLEGCETHMKNCKFEMVQCKNRPCQKKLFRRDILKHETNDCTHRCVKCKHCKRKVSTAKPEDHNCIEDLISALKAKKELIKKKNLKIKSLEEENRKLKQAERDRQNIYSDSSFSVDIFSTDSSSSDLSTVSTDYVINWGTNTSDISLEFEGNLSDMEDDEQISIAIERSVNDPSVILVNSSLETSDIHNNTSDCIELPRASSSNHNSTINDISHETSDVLEISQSVDEDEQPRRPNKRRHAPTSLLSSDTSDNDDEQLEWWRPKESTASGSRTAEVSGANYTSSSAGQSSSSTCSSSVPTRSTLSKRKKYRSNSAEGEMAKGGRSSLESLDLDDQPAFTTRGAFEKTLAMLERYNLESDPEWVPGLEDAESDVVSEQSADSVSADSSPSSDDEESEEYISVNVPPTFVLKRNSHEVSSSDDGDTEDPDLQL